MGYEGDDDDIRASEAERERTREALSRHYAAGRLDLAEFTDRTGAASAATTVRQLRVLFHDLPAPHPEIEQARRAAPGRTSLPAQVSRQPAGVYAPYGLEPISGLPYSDRQRTVAGVLQILLGVVGAGRFYTGRTGVGVAQLLLTLLSFGLLSPVTLVWGVVDGVIMLTGNGTDRHGRPLR